MADDAVITLRDVYLTTQSIAANIAKMEADLRIAVDARADHEDRLRALEKWMYALPPTFLLAAASIVITLLK